MCFHIANDRINVFAGCRSGSSSLKVYFGLAPDLSDGKTFHKLWYTIDTWHNINLLGNTPSIIFIRHPYARLKSAIKLNTSWKNIRLSDHVPDFYNHHAGPYMHKLVNLSYNFNIARTEDINDYIGIRSGPKMYVTDNTLDGVDWTELPFTKNSMEKELETYNYLLNTHSIMSVEKFRELTK